MSMEAGLTEAEIVGKAMAEAAGFAWENCAQSQWVRDAQAGILALNAHRTADMALMFRDIARIMNRVLQEPSASTRNEASRMAAEMEKRAECLMLGLKEAERVGD